jgi:hypothetical protein
LAASTAVLATSQSDPPKAARSNGVTVSPEFFEFTIDCEESVIDTLAVTTPPGGSIQAADVLFIMDVTGSMADELNEVKASAINIMGSILDLGIDAAFGVGTFSDYPDFYMSCGYTGVYGFADEGDYAWRMDQDVTTDTASVRTAIEAIVLQNGVDDPENYARALYETMFYSFRPDTRRIVLMFGDAPVHSCDFVAVSYGADPGRDEVIGNADDLDYVTVVADLAAAGITVLTLDSSGGVYYGAWENFEYMAVETGGGHYELSEAAEIPGAILELISEVSVIDEMTLVVDPADDPPYGPWLVTIPSAHLNVLPETTVEFEVQITAVGNPLGPHTFDLLVLEDGANILATVPVAVDVTGSSATETMSWGQLRMKFRKLD